MTPLFKQKDNADAQLKASINASTLTLIVKSGQGSLFPQPIKSSATSLGTSTVLNKTSAGSLGLTVNDYIFNITDGSWAFIVAVNTNDIETTPLYGGVDNTWESADEFATRRFVATLNKRDSNGNIIQSEQVLIDDRSGDTLTVPTGGRGYNGTTPLPFNADDYLSILVDELLPNGIESTMSGIDNKKFEKDFSQSIPNNTTFKGRNNAGTANIDLFKLTASDIFEFQTHPRTFAGRVIANNQDLIDLQYFNANLPSFVVLQKAPGSAANGELFENTSDNNSLSYKNNAGSVERVKNTVKIGSSSWSVTGNGQTKTVAHGLGRTPKLLTVNWGSDAGGPDNGDLPNGTFYFDGTTLASFFRTAPSAGNASFATDSTEVIVIKDGSGLFRFTVTTLDATNFIFTSSSYSSSHIINFTFKVE